MVSKLNKTVPNVFNINILVIFDQEKSYPAGLLLFRPASRTGMSRKSVTSRTSLACAPVSLQRYANAALRKLSDQVYQTFRTAPCIYGGSGNV
jgi:hypothetical protein